MPKCLAPQLALLIACLWPASVLSGQQPSPTTENVTVPLSVQAGRPLRLYLTKRVTFREGDVVHAKFAEAVWVFDREMIPAGTSVEGRVTKLTPVSPMIRAMAIVRGDFTPLKRAEVDFNTMLLPTGRSVHLETVPSQGLESIYVPTSNPKKVKPKKTRREGNAKVARLRALAKQQAQSQINSRTRGFLDFVRGPNKREWIENFLWGKLPYHPQWYVSGTRFDAVLQSPVDLGNLSVKLGNLGKWATQPPADATAMVRLLNTVSSSDAHPGDPIQGVLSEPLFSTNHELILPQGTELTGKVTLARSARMFHRGGKLRFTFEEIKPPALTAASPVRPPERTQAQLTGAEQNSGSIAVDEEGTAKATESRVRLLRPVIAGLVAAKSADNDEGKQGASGAASSNYSGRALGGFSGFGLFGIAAAQGPRPLGAALGYYGLAWSVYSTIISRGREVTFEKNTAMSIRFGAPARSR